MTFIVELLQPAQETKKGSNIEEESEEDSDASDEESEEEPSRTPKKNVKLSYPQICASLSYYFG